MNHYLSLPQVRKALHIYDVVGDRRWTGCSDALNAGWNQYAHFPQLQGYLVLEGVLIFLQLWGFFSIFGATFGAFFSSCGAFFPPLGPALGHFSQPLGVFSHLWGQLWGMFLGLWGFSPTFGAFSQPLELVLDVMFRFHP